MARSPVSPGGSRSGTRHVSFEEERLRAKLLRLTAEEPEIMRDIASAKAKWYEGLKSAREEVTERRRACAGQSESKASATTLHCGIVLAVVLTIAGMTYHNGHSKCATLQPSAVDQAQKNLGDTGETTVEDTGGNVPEPQEYNWRKKNTPENPVFTPFQGLGHSNDQPLSRTT